MKDLEQHPDADDEIESAVRYYEERSLKAPFNFIAELRAAFRRIRQEPTIFRRFHGEYRRFNLTRFPYAVVFRDKTRSVFVIAVVHQKQRPLYWIGRIEDDTD